MNAGAYGRDWSDVLARALVVTADGDAWMAPDELGLAYRHSELGAADVVAASSTGSSRARPPTIKATVAELVAQRKATQPTNKRTFGSVFKNPPGEIGAGRMLELCGLKGHRIGGAVISPKHANFIENADGATSADCVALMVEARRRAHEEFGVELEREVVFAGAPGASAAHVGGAQRTPNPAAWSGDEARADRVGMLLRQASSSRFREVRPVLAWISCASSPPAARCSPSSAFSRASASRTASRRRRPSSPSSASTSAARHPRWRAR